MGAVGGVCVCVWVELWLVCVCWGALGGVYGAVLSDFRVLNF